MDQTQQFDQSHDVKSFNWTFRYLRFEQLSTSEEVKPVLSGSATSLKFLFFLSLEIILGIPFKTGEIKQLI